MDLLGLVGFLAFYNGILKNYNGIIHTTNGIKMVDLIHWEDHPRKSGHVFGIVSCILLRYQKRYNPRSSHSRRKAWI